jgi:hypothetical protein
VIGGLAQKIKETAQQEKQNAKEHKNIEYTQ